ncbi:hypothetical protein COLO4_24517 [Corchorus olitorius]|uniref:Uncharacterized protein n=1 Tax=Corchorus olitorius TaxID=93759 RepID=A0A1R3I9E5_9ROSI|nr:hypothetical protein COLO4_24517 [Corchorus olitorius]
MGERVSIFSLRGQEERSGEPTESSSFNEFPPPLFLEDSVPS